MDPCPWHPLIGSRMYFGWFKCFDLHTYRAPSYVSNNIFKIPNYQACNLNLCVTATLPWISSCTLLIISFLKIWGDTIASVLNIMLLSTVNLCRALKGLSAIVQLLHTFFLMRSSIPLSIRSCWVSLLSILRDSTYVSTHCIILSSEFSCFSSFSLKNPSHYPGI